MLVQISLKILWAWLTHKKKPVKTGKLSRENKRNKIGPLKIISTHCIVVFTQFFALNRHFFLHNYIALLNFTFNLKVWAMYEILPGRSAGVFYTYYDGRGCVLLEAGYSQVHSVKLRKTHWIVCSQVGRRVVSNVGFAGSRS